MGVYYENIGHQIEIDASKMQLPTCLRVHHISNNIINTNIQIELRIQANGAHYKPKKLIEFVRKLKKTVKIKRDSNEVIILTSHLSHFQGL